MSSTMYLNNGKEIAAASRAAKELGYTGATNADIKANDRYVSNIVTRLAGADRAEQRELEMAIVDAVAQVRL